MTAEHHHHDDTLFEAAGPAMSPMEYQRQRDIEAHLYEDHGCRNVSGEIAMLHLDHHPERKDAVGIKMVWQPQITWPGITPEWW